jgi:hypothetical protein
MTVAKYLALLAYAALIGACSSEPSTPPASETASGSGGPRVFFIEPKNGATVKSPVHLMFGIQNFEIAPVPAGTVETARPKVGHHHVGVDTECLPPGSEIPRASPWVHFGKGDSMMDMQLPPGPHKLALQIGDDKHTTIDGLCSTVDITVAP